MLHSYRISKYNPSHSEAKRKEEWTSLCDIQGEEAMKEYLLIEDAYIHTVLMICNHHSISALKITDLEDHRKRAIWQNNQIVGVEQFSSLLRSILREEIGCKLIGEESARLCPDGGA